MPSDAEVTAAAGALSTVGWFSSKAADKLARVALEAAEAVREVGAGPREHGVFPGANPYRCGVCGAIDPETYQRCYHPGCPDGRDR